MFVHRCFVYLHARIGQNLRLNTEFETGALQPMVLSAVTKIPLFLPTMLTLCKVPVI